MWILIIPFIALCVLLASFLNALAFNLLWLWFLVPLGLPVIGLAHSYGLIVLAALLQRIQPTEAKSEKQWEAAVTNLFTKPVVSIMIGYVVKTFFLGQ